MATGSYCGPAPERGNGLGPDGECTGQEQGPPCGAGTVAGKYYAYTLPGHCQAVIFFDGKKWLSELPPPSDAPDSYVWMAMTVGGRLGFIGPTGAVGYDPYTGSSLPACTT